MVLGQAEPTELTPDKLLSMLQPLVTGQRYRTASALILLHRETAERLLSERWATDYEDASVQLIANVLSSRSARAENSWIALLRIARDGRHLPSPTKRRATHLLCNCKQPILPMSKPRSCNSWRLTLTIHSSKSTGLRLLACANWCGRSYGLAESLCRQAADTLITRAMFLLQLNSLCDCRISSSQRSAIHSRPSLVERCEHHLRATNNSQPIDVAFWLMAERVRPENLSWPNELITSLGHQLPTMAARAMAVRRWSCGHA